MYGEENLLILSLQVFNFGFRLFTLAQIKERKEQGGDVVADKWRRKVLAIMNRLRMLLDSSIPYEGRIEWEMVRRHETSFTGTNSVGNKYAD